MYASFNLGAFYDGDTTAIGYTEQKFNITMLPNALIKI
jgi:hypothetical protein